MKMLRMLSQEQRRALRKLLALSSVEGVVTGLLLPLLNYAAVHEFAPTLLLSLAGVYMALLLTSYWLRYFSGARIAILLDEVLRDTRLQIAGAIRAAELRTTEAIADLQTAFTRDIERLEELPYKVVDFLRYLSMLISVGVYVLVLSGDSFVLWLLLVVALIAALYPEVARGRRITREENASWSEFHAGLRDGLDGFKQLKLDPAARRSVARALEQEAERLLELRLRRDFCRRNMEIRGTFVIELGIGAVLFVAPLQLEFDTALLFQLVTILFFTLDPATSVARELHVFVAAGVSLRQLEQLEARLSDGRERADAGDDDGLDQGPGEFSRLELRGLYFDYLDDEGNPSFSVGPIDLTIERGSLVLIRGGNGSGKT
ncbi:MAG: hypothetical protein KC431_15270, partial [Myxococcales bacterium]|nr:hypothetical protein [Myxococcales bacterium]